MTLIAVSFPYNKKEVIIISASKVVCLANSHSLRQPAQQFMTTDSGNDIDCNMCISFDGAVVVVTE